MENSEYNSFKSPLSKPEGFNQDSISDHFLDERELALKYYSRDESYMLSAPCIKEDQNPFEIRNTPNIKALEAKSKHSNLKGFSLPKSVVPEITLY